MHSEKNNNPIEANRKIVGYVCLNYFKMTLPEMSLLFNNNRN